MTEITCIGIRENYGWVCVGYDLGCRYGYEMMLFMFDKFIAGYAVRVDRVAKAMLASMRHDVVWRRWPFRKAQPLSGMDALKEECGEVAVGGTSKRLDDLQLYITLTNQTSIVTIQVPQENYTDAVKSQLDLIARFFQTALVSGD